MYLQYYLEELGYLNVPEFLKKYLYTPSLLRLKGIGYFCGMDYASKNIYNFGENISRYDHSLSVGLMVYRFTRDKEATIAGLFHDVATPCFSHVIDYMNKDYIKQESTEGYTEYILRKDRDLINYLKEDNINIEDIINYKKYTVVDNERPKVCADRMDGIILTGIGWTKNIDFEDIYYIINDLNVYNNEFGEREIGFKSLDMALRVVDINNTIDRFCHSKEDNYMMMLLADITKYAIDKKYISYDDLYTYREADLFKVFKSFNDDKLNNMIYEFKNINKKEIPDNDYPMTKVRSLKPLVRGIRI